MIFERAVPSHHHHQLTRTPQLLMSHKLRVGRLSHIVVVSFRLRCLMLMLLLLLRLLFSCGCCSPARSFAIFSVVYSQYNSLSGDSFFIRLLYAHTPKHMKSAIGTLRRTGLSLSLSCAQHTCIYSCVRRACCKFSCSCTLYVI